MLHVSVLTLIREESLVPKCSKNKGNSCDISKGTLQNDVCRFESGPVDGVVGIEGGVVSGVINLESSGVGASDWRPRHGKHYQEV